jgi:hypothetical protein
VIDAAREAFTGGVATTIKAAALVALVAAGLVMVLWPGNLARPHRRDVIRNGLGTVTPDRVGNR